MAKKAPQKNPLKWITDYQKYLTTTRARVFNDKGREIMRRDASSKGAAIAALKRFGYLDKNGRVSAKYATKSN